MKKNKILLPVIAATVSVANFGQPLADINIRNPYILPDTTSGYYYMYASSSVKGKDGQLLGGVKA